MVNAEKVSLELRKCAKGWESVRGCAKRLESIRKVEKLWERVLKAKKDSLKNEKWP